MTDPTTTTTAAKPSGLTAAIVRVEKAVVAVGMGIMGVVVFFDVIHRMASRDRGVLMRMLSGHSGEDATWANPIGTALGCAVLLGVCYAALRTRGEPATRRTAIKSVVVAGAIYGGLRLFVFVLPNGLVWSQTLGLVLMLWVGLVGASLAAHEHRHLSLDLGSKLWPKKALPMVQAVGNVVTAGFCLVFAFLAVKSLGDHFKDYADTDGAGGIFVALPIPKWAAFSVIPVAFVIMAVRFLAQARDGVLKGEIEDDDPLKLLGMAPSSSSDGSSVAVPATKPTLESEAS
ncbi:MAG: TRAP transporter small permease [Deltaproteobacteria bacterium]|nr:TRAP transporter small permease [Deltaproteobacteria bacterium]